MKDKEKIAFILNIVILILEIVGLLPSIYNHGFLMFTYYTQDSNFFSLVVSLIFVITALKNKDREVSGWVKTLRFMATSNLMLTFLIVLTVLWPLSGPKGIIYLAFRGANLPYHVLCPILSFVSFIWFEDIKRISIGETVRNVIPTLCYAIVAVLLNWLRVIRGPYPFLLVHDQPFFMSVIWFVLILGIAWFIPVVIRLIKNRMLARK